MPGTSPCGIGGPQNPGGPCSGTYYNQLASQAGNHVFDGVHTGNVVLALLAAGAIVAGVFFARWIVGKVGGFFQHKRELAEADERAAANLRKSWQKTVDYADLGQKLHEYGGYDDAEDDAEADSEDDAEDEEALEYKPGSRA